LIHLLREIFQLVGEQMAIHVESHGALACPSMVWMAFTEAPYDTASDAAV
jgi:hypothetical protein